MIKPMLSTLADEPFDSKDYLFEIKFDGYRAIAETGKNLQLYSRNGNSFLEKYPPITQELKKIKENLVLDGEIVALDKEGHSRFQLLQNYENQPNVPLYYYVFDLLRYKDEDLTDLNLIERKEKLKVFLSKFNFDKIRYSDHILARGKDFFKFVKEKNLEGMIAKKIFGKYFIGKRTKDWLKIKMEKRQEALICGFTEPRGSRKYLGALILGVYKDDKLKYVGHTGGGFNDKDLKEMREVLEPLKQPNSPFDNIPKTNAPVTWVKPKLICEVKFSEWTKSGTMRHPIFIALREDKKSEQVVPEREIHLTNLDKIYWPEKGYTKGDLIDYYDKISEVILPYLKDRPLTLHRHPNGIYGNDFYQKNVDFHLPNSIQTKQIFSKSNEEIINYLICNDRETLLYIANLGCIEINPWNATVNNKDYPTYLVFDLDPVEIDFKECVKTAKKIKEILDELKMKGYVKTSGKRGLHIYCPTGEKYTTEQIRNLSELIARVAFKEMPETISLERKPEKRKNKVYIDYLQNRRNHTMIAPYSLRATAEATVSTPIDWSELNKGLLPTRFSIKTIFKYLEQKGDLFKPVLGQGFDLKKSLKKLNSLLSG